MSYDRKIDRVCSHQVVEEALFFGNDRTTVQPLRPVGAIQSMKVRFNGLMDVPSEGARVAAQAIASNKGPFDIQAGVNDTFVVLVNGREQTVTVTPGSQLTAGQVAFDLNRLVSQAIFYVSNKGRIRMRTGLKGSKASLFIRSSSTLAATLGFTMDRMWRGQTIIPGWSLVRDPNTLNDRPSRFVVFDSPASGTSDFVELTYTTIRQECRRCGGTGVENDWVYGSTGEVVQVRDEALLIQEILKMAYTERGSNPFHEWYGSNLLRTIGKKISSSGLVQNLVVADISEAFRRWQAIKRKQEEEVGQVVTDSEFPFRLLNISLIQSQQDPTVMFVDATVQNRSRQPIQIERGIKVPGPVDLLGATAQQGVFRQSLSDYTLIG
jgi:phage baseplate assembly protein W